MREEDRKDKEIYRQKVKAKHKVGARFVQVQSSCNKIQFQMLILMFAL